MSAAPDTIVLTGPVLQQILADNLLVTPTGGSQQTLADALTGGGGVSGPVAATTLTASSTVTLSPASKNVTVSPSGTGTVTISPVGALTINPTAASTINNTSVGVTTAAAGKFTTFTATTSATIAADNGLKLTSQTTDAGAQTATMTNGPTAGNPAFWLRISINGTNVAVPAWTAV